MKIELRKSMNADGDCFFNIYRGDWCLKSFYFTKETEEAQFKKATTYYNNVLDNNGYEKLEETVFSKEITENNEPTKS